MSKSTYHTIQVYIHNTEGMREKSLRSLFNENGLTTVSIKLVEKKARGITSAYVSAIPYNDDGYGISELFDVHRCAELYTEDAKLKPLKIVKAIPADERKAYNEAKEARKKAESPKGFVYLMAVAKRA